MLWSSLRAWCCLSTVCVVLGAVDITGTIVVTHRLSRMSVTPPAGAYQPGASQPNAHHQQRAASEPLADRDADPLEYERRHVAIFLEGSLPSTPISATMEQKGRAFSPHTLVIPAGSEVSFPNLDPIFHNVFSLSRTKAFDLGNYAEGESRSVVFPQTGLVFVRCRLHPNMSAEIVVTPNSWATVPDASGRFVLADVPPGEYTVVAWSKAVGELRRPVAVTADRGAEVEFLVPLGDRPARPAKGSRK
jgi:plastocyanin